VRLDDAASVVVTGASSGIGRATVRRPRTRYRVGVDARAMRALTWLLPDRFMDALILRASGLHRAAHSR
jgi:NADP-dependent 3-hydroxy acid dehydrogenase YdfG